MSTRLHYRLELIQDISVPGISYGSVDVGYGDGIYGERAADPTDLQTYVAVPVASGYNAPHLIEAYVGDVFPADPIAFRIMAFGGPFETANGAVLDVATIDTAEMRIDRLSTGPAVQAGFEMVVDTDDNVVRREMTASDLTEPGLYRIAVILTFLSGRRLTVPASDYTTLVVRSNTSTDDGTPTDPGTTYSGIQGGTAAIQGTDGVQGGTAATQGTDTIQGEPA